MDCKGLFDDSVDFEVGNNNMGRSGTAQLGKVASVHICSSMDYKLLLAHADQIAVFDITPDDCHLDGGDKSEGESESESESEHENASSSASSSGNNDNDNDNGIAIAIAIDSDAHEKEQRISQNRGEILWTTRVRATISAAAISGDGRSIAYVLEGEGVGVPYPFGVRTLIRDKEDGSNLNDAQRGTGRSSRPPRPPPFSATNNGTGAGANKSAFGRYRAGGITPPPIPTPTAMNGESTLQYPDIEHSSLNDDGNHNDHENDSQVEHNNMGIVYKTGPFLVHSTTVTRISFRGLGLNHSSIYHDNSSNKNWNAPGMRDGNDLLLTCCSSDGSFRVFSQGSWKILFHWDTPPGSRADWIHGITMANLGDLDPLSKSKMRKNNIPMPTRSHDDNANANANANANVNSSRTMYNGNGNGNGNGASTSSAANAMTPPRSNQSPKKMNQTRNTPSPSSGWQSQLMPNSAAGAWISEITFRGPYPALRLSRLSFLKSGGDSWAPAHFDSVGTILPPATLLPQCVLHNLESTSMVVQGIWSAWNPWVSHPGSGGNVVEDESMSGNAMALLGSVPYGHGGSAGDADAAAFGGTHSPPAELRIIASHVDDKVVIMEFPLWGDTDFGAMQLGSPLRYLMNLKEYVPEDVKVSKMIEGSEGRNDFAPLPVTVSTRCACLDFESNSLCAAVTEDRKNITLEWRKKGTMNIHRRESEDSSDSDVSIATTISIDSAENQSLNEKSLYGEIEQFSDWSINPLPLSLPSLHLPTSTDSDECISLLKWWPDENFGGPPRLFTFTTAGTLILYEMPPPWSALEPITPDPFTLNAMGNSFQSRSEHGSLSDRGSYDDDDNDSLGNIETVYEVQLTPHPDFGLGLRLEAQADGTPAIAGSYKKHPLTGGRLPAERTGKIVLGDELISINDVSLEGITFNDIISTVRTVSAAAEGGPLKMKFRALERNRMLRENLSNLTPDRLPVDEGLEIVHQRSGEDGDHTSILVGADAETQQEFGKIVAIIPSALPPHTKSRRSLVLLPWQYGKFAPAPYEVRGAALLVSAVGRTITASRLEICNGFEPESCGKMTRLGSVQLKEVDNESDIVSLTYIKTVSDGWCVGTCDGRGRFQVVFIDVTEENGASQLSASFRTYEVLESLDGGAPGDDDEKEYLVRASSVELLGAMPMGGNCTQVSVWTPAPFVLNENEGIHSNYVLTNISHKEVTEEQPILDFQWIPGGGVDAYPWLVTFGHRSAVVHCRPQYQDTWIPVAELFYSSIKETCGTFGTGLISFDKSLAPSHAMPHLIMALRNIVNATGEEQSLLADWHPESMLAMLCSEPRGPEVALKKQIKGLTKWLARAMDPDDSMTMHWVHTSRLPSAPFDSIYDSYDVDDCVQDEYKKQESADALFLNISSPPKQMSEEEKRLQTLQDCIRSNFEKKAIGSIEEDSQPKYSREFMMAMDPCKAPNSSEGTNEDIEEINLPDPIKDLCADELCFLWTMGELCYKPPNFQGLDNLAQLAVLSLAILRQVKTSRYEDASEDLSATLVDVSPRSFLVKKASFFETTLAPQEMKIASSACLSALLSDSQSRLLQTCKPEGRWTWEEARILNLPFWVRSDNELKKISEEIAQQIYKESKDAMESALFYVITGNMRMLKTIAAADRNQTGRTFLKFINSHDFSSKRGRKAAEKNAFSLLRKRKYGPAVAFFLLAEPPILNSALSVIVTKMKDFALAFFVSRLMEANRSKSSRALQGNLTIGGGFSLRGLGGGGGFASQQSDVADSDYTDPEGLYEDWCPQLSKVSRNLLESQAIPKDIEDPFLQCIDLIWLNRPNDAAKCLMGTTFTDIKTSSKKSNVEALPLAFRSNRNLSNNQSQSASCRVVNKVNSMFDFASKPAIVKKMKLPAHAQWFISLSTSRAFCHRGIESSSMIILSDDVVNNQSGGAKERQFPTDTAKSTDPNVVTVNPTPSRSKPTSSSIFDSFDAPPLPKTKVETSTVSGQMTSSIFDSFDATAPPKTKQVQTATSSGQMSSSIFDSFDGPPPPKRKENATPQNALNSGQMASSIFDSFNTAPPAKQKAPVVEASGQMSSSIFDSFDTAPPAKQKAPVVEASGQMSSSIFDSFDTAPPAKQKAPVVEASGQMTSSIFDSFDTAPPAKQKAPVVEASGQMTSSIFDSFDTAPTSKSKNPSQIPSSASGQMTSIQNPMQAPISTSFDSEHDKVSGNCSSDETQPPEEELRDSTIVDFPIPLIWDEWRQHILTTGVARRLLREMARVITPFLGDVDHTPIDLFRRHIHPLIPCKAAHVFQEVCEGEVILSILVDILDKLCSTFKVSKAPVVDHALLILGCPSQPQRIVFAVLLHCLTGRADLAEDVMRDAAQDQVNRCDALLSANDDLVHNRKTKHYVSSQYMRRQAASSSLQLEICLWLHRGGAFPMSGLALKEATIGVRIGYFVAGWGRCHEALENLLKCDPDCPMDFERGRQLWSSMKMILSLPEEEEHAIESAETTSGGWEFLVDCNREEATNLLSPRKCGSFLLRPSREDHGIFTLSFRSNLKPREETKDDQTQSDEGSSKPKKREESVKHAIVRLSDVGFKCGSFGPFSSLLKLLEAVSSSLPFDLLFSEPPAQGIIKEEGGQPSPNSVIIRKLALHSMTDHYRWNASTRRQKKNVQQPTSNETQNIPVELKKEQSTLFQQTEQDKAEFERLRQFGMFSQLLVITELRKQISAVVACSDEKLDERSTWKDSTNKAMSDSFFEGSLHDSIEGMGELELDSIASRMIRPFLNWCHALEISIVSDLLPMLSEISQRPASSMPVALSASATAIEVVPTQIGSDVDCGDAIIRRMIQKRSGVDFRTLRVGEAGHSAVVVLFRRSQAISWIIRNGAEINDVDAAKRLHIMERRRVIERVDLNSIAYERHMDHSAHNDSTDVDNDIRYRFVDPWEVEVLESKDAELRGAALGRERYVPFTIGAVARACEESQRDLGGLHLLSLWATARGGVGLTKAIASVYPPWERDAGGDLEVNNGVETQPTTYANSFRQHLYRNTLFSRLRLPQRFLAFLQVEVLDLKNLTAPGGSPSLTAYALLRLKRDASNAPLTDKARTLDSASTEPRKINRSSGPNAPASWGSVVRFRFPLPEGINCDGVSFDSDREALFKGAPSVLQISVYEKKFMTNSALGGADVNLDALSTRGQLEEWVPLRSANDDITWFARLRLTLRFELMCLASDNKASVGSLEDQCPSAGLRKMKMLSRMGGVHEDDKGVQRSMSSPDIVEYFGNMVS